MTGAVAEQATLGFEKETYPNETDCTYVIRTLPNLRIQVSIKIFLSVFKNDQGLTLSDLNIFQILLHTLWFLRHAMLRVNIRALANFVS